MIFAAEAHAALLVAALPAPVVVVKTAAEFVAAIIEQRPLVAFIDIDLVAQVDGLTTDVAIVGIIDDTLAQTVKWLQSVSSLAHVVTVGLLSTPKARAHLEMLRARLEQGPGYDTISADSVGRVALLAGSNRREARLERMRDFFAKQGLSISATSSIIDVAEELITNALYDAPVEAGYFPDAIPRTDDVELPPEHACEVSYGMDQGNAFVRVRDPFGALTRARSLDVLRRCNANGVSLDESRGGAGLGLWRVFTTASKITISVIPGRVTDVLVWVAPKKRGAGKHLLAIHMFFPGVHSLDGARGRFAADHDDDLMDESFTAVHVA